MNERIQTVFSNLGLEKQLIEEIMLVGRMKKTLERQIIISPDMTVREIPFVVSGLLKVMSQEPGGDAVFLYYLQGGETCAMSIACCIEGKQATYKLAAVEDTEMWMVPIANLDGWVVKYRSFRRFIFNSYQMRFEELLSAIDGVVFYRMDERLFRYLLDTKQATGSYEIHKTHQEISDELNTSRVVVSRLLKQLEKDGKIAQFRNRIDIL